MPRYRIPGRALPAVAALFFLALSACDMSADLWNSEELGKMYQVDLSQGRQDIRDGMAVALGKPLDLALDARPGAPDPAALDILLSDTAGHVRGSLRFVDGSYRGNDQALALDDLLSELSPVILPSGLEPGYYFLQVSGYDDAGTRLFDITRVLLVLEGPPPELALSVYPSAVAEGDPVLVKLGRANTRWSRPWIRWDVDGLPVLEGYADEARLDRLSWEAPLMSGIYEVSVHLYPERPPDGFRLVAPASVSVEIPVRVDGADLVGQVPLPVRWRYSFKGAALYLGGSDPEPSVRLASRAYPESSGNDFGMVLGDDVALPASALALASGLHTSIAIRVGSLPGRDFAELDAVLVSGRAESGEATLELGVREGRQWLRVYGRELVSSLPVPAAGGVLAWTLRQDGDSLSVSFAVNGTGAPEVSLGVEPGLRLRSSEAVLEADAPLVVMDLAVLEGPFPAYLISAMAEYGRRLVVASGFETAEPGPGLGALGNVVVKGGLARLGQADGLAVAGSPLSGGPVEVRLGTVRGVWTADFALPDGTVVSIRSDGLASHGKESLGRLPTESGAFDALVVDPAGRVGLSVKGPWIATPDLSGAALRFGALGSALIDSLLVRYVDIPAAGTE
ncbi:MAG: hypothetical protein JW923_08705 [Spirochaetales bacterium]|nr:hypothetical protein [Spirochaetales bacterium]